MAVMRGKWTEHYWDNLTADSLVELSAVKMDWRTVERREAVSVLKMADQTGSLTVKYWGCYWELRSGKTPAE